MIEDSSSTLVARTIALGNGRSALGVVAPATVRGDEAVEALGLPRPRGVVVLNGGTRDFSPELRAALAGSLGAGLARTVVEERLTTVTGGTDAGIFALFGAALEGGSTAPCVGVAPEALVTWPGRPPLDSREAGGEERCPLEPHHSHFLLVTGGDWGVETDAMLSLANALSAGTPSLAVLAGGGRIARREVRAHVQHRRRVIVLAGSGRFADVLVDELEGRGGGDADAREIARSGLVTAIAVTEPPVALAHAVRVLLALDSGSVPQ